MIERYTRPEMKKIWDAETRFKNWLEIEILTLEALARQGRIPEDVVKRVRKNAKFDIARIDEIEKVTRHDVVAFTTNVGESLGEDARYIHFGLTSSDVLDSCYAMQLKASADLLLADLETLQAALKKKALEHKQTVMIGRTHGIHAEPTTFGLKLAGWYAEVGRHIARLQAAREEIAYGKLSGAVGTLAHLTPEVEEFVLGKCGLKPEPVATQVVPRDRHAQYFTALAGIASSIERFATEVRHLQRTEVYEAEEFFSPGQKGSSAMPHKRNPVLSENLVGLARLVRSYAIAALENVALWHERDISHSSVERVIGPDADILVDFMLSRFTGLVSKLLVYPENMKKNMAKMGKLIFSESILLALIEKGLTREAAYKLVQRNAMRVWEEGGDFEKYLMADADVTKLITVEEISAALNLEHHLQRVDYIFKRVFGS